jgi:hypothetical protein
MHVKLSMYYECQQRFLTRAVTMSKHHCMCCSVFGTEKTFHLCSEKADHSYIVDYSLYVLLAT